MTPLAVDILGEDVIEITCCLLPTDSAMHKDKVNPATTCVLQTATAVAPDWLTAPAEHELGSVPLDVFVPDDVLSVILDEMDHSTEPLNSNLVDNSRCCTIDSYTTTFAPSRRPFDSHV